MDNVKRLPDCYQKSKKGNNYKLLALNQEAIQELKDDIQAVRDSLDLSRAYGNTLDQYGDMMQQKRGLLNDDQYRYMLYAKMGQNTAKGDYNSIMDTLVLMFNSQRGDITLDDMELEESERPCLVSLTKFPLFVLINAGFSSRQAVQMIESLLPVCVKLAADNFEGTFEFSELDNEADDTAGFADLNQTIGGYLGLLLGEDDSIPVLPIGR